MPNCSHTGELGHILSAARMAPDNSNVQAIQNWLRPNDVTAVKQFLGLALEIHVHHELCRYCQTSPGVNTKGHHICL